MSQLIPLTQQLTRRPQRMALLEQIAIQGSITRAAKAAGLSYKAAWDAIDELNNLAEKPLVERSVGARAEAARACPPRVSACWRCSSAWKACRHAWWKAPSTNRTWSAWAA